MADPKAPFTGILVPFQSHAKSRYSVPLTVSPRREEMHWKKRGR
jgi:hypothetical protein